MHGIVLLIIKIVYLTWFTNYLDYNFLLVLKIYYFDKDNLKIFNKQEINRWLSKLIQKINSLVVFLSKIFWKICAKIKSIKMSCVLYCLLHSSHIRKYSDSNFSKRCWCFLISILFQRLKHFELEDSSVWNQNLFKLELYRITCVFIFTSSFQNFCVQIFTHIKRIQNK